MGAVAEAQGDITEMVDFIEIKIASRTPTGTAFGRGEGMGRGGRRRDGEGGGGRTGEGT